MESDEIPHINTAASVISHAHSILQAEEGLKSSAASLRDLVTQVNLDVVLRGFANEQLPPSCALVFPCVRRSSPTKHSVQHLDIVSCWKGLSPSQALELAMWECLFKESLALQIKQWLQQGFMDRLSKYSDPMNEAHLISRMVEFLMFGDCLMVNVSMKRLVHDIISHLYTVHRSDMIRGKFDWSLSSGRLPNFVYNFVRTNDCLLHTSDGLCLLFDLSHSYCDGVLTAFANVHWHLPRISFSTFLTPSSNDETCRIIPHFVDAVLGASSHNEFSPSRDEIRYSVTRSSLPLRWDCARDCFYTHAAIGSEGEYGQIESVLCAKITTPFYEGVYLERMSRYSIKLEVCDTEQANASFCNNDLFHHEVNWRQRTDHACDISWLNPRLQGFFEPRSDPVAQSLQDPESPWMPSYTSTPRSKTRYWASQTACSKNTNPRPRRDSFHDQISGVCHITQWDYKAASLDRTRPVFENVWQQNSLKEIRASPSKRKARQSISLSGTTGLRIALPRLERPDPGISPKRRKLGQNDGEEVHSSAEVDVEASAFSDDSDATLDASLATFTTSLKDEPQNLLSSNAPCALEKLRNFGASSMPKSDVTAFTDLRTCVTALFSPDSLPDNNRATIPWSIRKEISVSSLCASSSPNDKTTLAPIASTNTSASTGALSQEQIQHNYQEFEERKRQRAAEKIYYTATVPGFDSVVSPTDEDNKSFERMFFEDSDAGDDIEDVDELSDEMDSACLAD